MPFSISWTDYPEDADKQDYIKNCRIIPVNNKSENRNPSEKNSEESFTQDSHSYQSKVDSEHSQLAANKKNILNPEELYTFISGDNYPVLQLLQDELSEKIDLIYIDPPYNTGKKFVYNDAFFSDKHENNDEKKYSSNKDSHSVWLSFMQRRLKLAKKVLKEEGCIFIAIGSEELYHLKLLCDMIFGEGNFVNDFKWLCGKGKKDKFSRTLEQSHLCYAKNIRRLKEFSEFQESAWAKDNLDNDSRGPWFSGSISFSEKRSNPQHKNYFEILSPSGIRWKRQWLHSRQEIEDMIKDNRIYWGPAPEYSNVPRSKIFNGQKTEIIPKNMIEGQGPGGVGTTRDAQNYVDKLLGIKNAFDNPKPVALLEHFIKITGMKNDIRILDFFAGSGTTMEAVYSLNQKDGGKRKCILIQKAEEISNERNIFSDISQLCLERCKRAGISNIAQYRLIEG